jgi:hypothetical protein
MRGDMRLRFFCCYFFDEPKLCVAGMVLLMSAVHALPCISLQKRVTLKSAACWWREKQTLLRRRGVAALRVTAIFSSLPILQRRQNCTHICHQLQQGRRRCISSQRPRPTMTRSVHPAAPHAAVSVNATAPRVAAAACRGLRWAAGA